jgi:hypothetical protein
MKSAEQRIKDLKIKLHSLTVESKNREVLNKNFGNENLQLLPFSDIEWSEGPIGPDGIWTFRLNLLTGLTSCECEIADGGTFNVIDKLDNIEKEIYKKLDEKGELY